MSSIAPNIGSIRGGSVVTVYGDGFSSKCSLNKVSFGPQNCQVLNCTSNRIKCRTSSAYLTYTIDNSASDPCNLIKCLHFYHSNKFFVWKDYGSGYAWNRPLLTINKGDTVNWSWKPPTGINGVSFQVEQLEDGISETANGFTSGAATSTGTFSYQFNQAGTYFYWSGHVEYSNQISFRGVIVVLDSVDKELELNVNLNGFNGEFKLISN